MLKLGMKKFFLFILEIVQIVAIALAIVIPIRYFLIQPFFVEGASMEPNFYNSQYLIIDEISYRFSEPERGDVIVFKYPANPSQHFIKRIIGLPGETVELKDKQIIIDNQVLDESSYSPLSSSSYGTTKHILGENEYFVMGDNRGASSDSRQWGGLSREYIVGKVWIRAWPLNTAKTF